MNLLSPSPARLKIERQTRLANDSLALDHISITEIICHNGYPPSESVAPDDESTNEHRSVMTSFAL